MKGIYNLRPPEPKYYITWDVAAVLSWLKDQGENKDLCLKELSGKLTLLMALVGTNRTSELQALVPAVQIFHSRWSSVQTIIPHEKEEGWSTTEGMLLCLLSP